MTRLVSFRISALALACVISWGCNQNTSSSTPEASNAPAAESGMPSGSPGPGALPPQHPPTEQQQMTLYMVPLNPANFSMDSIQANKKIIEKEPGNVQALIALGDANFMIQRFEKSQEFYERALKADPKQINARIGLSNTYLFLQRPDDSIRQLDKLLEVQKDYPEALYNKGLILLKSKGDAAGAKKAWNRLIEVHPDNSLAQDVKAELARM